MKKYSKIVWTLIIILLAGGSYHHIHELSMPSNHPPQKLLAQQSRIRKALNYIGNKDNGKAIVHYNRTDHILKFSILYMKDVNDFTGTSGAVQKKEFEHIAGVRDVVLQRDTLTAVKRRDIELRERYEQKLEDAAEKSQAQEQAEKEKLAQEKAYKKQTQPSLSQGQGNTSNHKPRHHVSKPRSKKGHHKL